MSPNERLLHDLTQQYYKESNPEKQQLLYNKMVKLSNKIAVDKLPRIGWWMVNPNPGVAVGIPKGSVYLGQTLTLQINGGVAEDEYTTPSNHSAVIYYGRR
jgi:hypothetical protein